MKKTIALSTTLLLLNFGLQTLPCLGQAGSLDLTFSTDGKVTTPVGTFTDEGNSIAIQSDGKIVVAGNTTSASFSTDFGVVRYLDNGTLDLTFSTDGKASAAIGAGGQAYGRAVAIQSDGKILVAGYAHNGTTYDFATARFDATGVLDNTFGTGGIVITPIGTGFSQAYGMALQTDGKIVVVGVAVGTTLEFALVRYNTDGSLDNTFDTDGIVNTDVNTSSDQAYAVAIQSDGKIVAAGMSDIARYNTNGSLDLTFSGNGTITAFELNNISGITDIAIQSDGKIVLSGKTVSSNEDFVAARLTTTGAYDNTFGTGGEVITSIGAGDDYATSVVIQADGRIVLGGQTFVSGGDADFALVRYNSNGTLDMFFDGDGKVVTPIGGSSSDDEIRALAIQPADGKIVAAGYATMVSANIDIAVTRYIGVCPLTAVPGTISGDATPCTGFTQTYSITAVSGATGYTWTVPAGTTITSGQGTTSITVTVGSTSGNISVTSDNNCGSSAAQTLAVAVMTTLPIPGTITGNISVCSGSSNTYSIAAVSGATGYTWTVPSGTVINSGQGTTSITVTAGANSGNVTVIANNDCGSSPVKTLTVTNAAPPQPGTITGDGATCSASSEVYSIAAVSGATGYTWTVPSGSVITSGQGTTSITVTIGTVTGDVTVSSSNACGNSAPKIITVNVTTPPATPGTITGNLAVCPGAANVTYSIAAVPGAVWYTWTVPPGSVINSGQNTSVISVTFGSTQGSIFVNANNSCGGSAAQSTPTLVNVPYSFFNYNATGLAVSFGNLCVNTSTYAWLFGDGGNSAAPSPVHNYPASGTYTVELTATGACGSHYYTKNISITDSTNTDDVSVDEIENVFHVSMYPNPTTGKFKIVVDGENVADNENFQVVVLNYFGQVVQQLEMNGKESEIDLRNSSNGIYFVKCIFKNRECMMKMLKE